MDYRCRICRKALELRFRAKVLTKYLVGYYFCPNCGFLQTEDPFWLEEAYGNPIADADTGLVQRNLGISRVLSRLIYFMLDRNGKYLDAAGGYGILTRLMRDFGFDFYWSDKYCGNIVARGFEASTTKPPFTAITAFEVLEHVQDPMTFLEELLSNSGTQTLIFSTELFNGAPPAPEDWWYYTFRTGQHISFYQKTTLRFIARELSLFLGLGRNVHMLTDKQIDPFIFKILESRYSSFLCSYVQMRMQSRTFTDHKKLIAS